MGLILDTSVLIAVERGTLDPDRLAHGREDTDVGMSAITVAELLHGVHRADSEARRLRREAYVERLIASLMVFPFDLTTARIYSRLWAGLARKGVSLGAHDLMIGATALALGYSVATMDLRDYPRIEGLTLVHFDAAST